MNNTSPCDYKALFLQIAEGDRNAFRAVFDLYRTPFYSAAFKMTRSSYIAEEIVQEVFILLWTKRALVAAADNPSAYLFSIVHNCIYAQFKKIASEKHMKEAILQDAKDWEEDTIEKVLQEKENRQLLDAVINQLPPRQQMIYRLSKLQGLSRIEIATQLHISPNSVRNHLQDAVKSIRHYLKDKEAALILLALYRFL
jgi:RNA polymerase sigma-70 factor (ECF subfamily)